MRNPGLCMPEEEDLHEIHLEDSPRTLESQEALGPRAACFRSRIHEICFIALAVLAASGFSTLQRATAIAIHLVAVDLDMTASQLGWTAGSSGLAAGVLLLPLTYACEGQTSRFLKAVLLGSLAFFALLAGLVSVSPTRLAFDALSAVCGVACAAHVASIAAMIRSAYVNNRPRQALIFIFALASGNSLGVAMGCLAGGLVATKFGWRATFTAIAVVFACITVLSSYAMPGSPRAKVRLHDEKAVIAAALFPRDVSFPPLPAVGTLLVFLGVCFTALALAAGPEAVGGWSSPVVIVLLATGLLSFAGLALVLGPYPNLGKLGGKAHADKQLARRRYGANGTDARTGRTVHHAAIESREPIRR